MFPSRAGSVHSRPGLSASVRDANTRQDECIVHPALGYRDCDPSWKENAMTTAREIMTGGAECVGENESLVDAARKMRDLDVGSLPICGEDNRLKGC